MEILIKILKDLDETGDYNTIHLILSNDLSVADIVKFAVKGIKENGDN